MKMIDITNKIPQCNYTIGRNGNKVEAIVLHITGDSNQGQAVSWFESQESKVSAHYVIEKDGTVYMCVNPANKAYHAGIVNHPTAQIYIDKDQINPNIYTIGIECVSSGEPLIDEQHKSLIELLNDLCNSYTIPCDRYHIIGHYELDSVNRKFDPIASYSVDDIVNSLKKGADIVSTFKDDNLIAEYAKNSIDNLEKLGIIKGNTDGKFNPIEPITRQDMAVVINNLYNLLKK